jgi:hypothetical protein
MMRIMSAYGTFETRRLRRAMSEFEVQSGKHMLVLSSSQFDPMRTLRKKCLVTLGYPAPGHELFIPSLPPAEFQTWG